MPNLPIAIRIGEVLRIVQMFRTNSIPVRDSFSNKTTLLSASCFLVFVTDTLARTGTINVLPFALILFFVVLWLLQPKRSVPKQQIPVIPDCILKVLEPQQAYVSNGTLVVIGKLTSDAEHAFEWLKDSLKGVGTPVLQGTQNRTVLLVSPFDFDLMKPQGRTRPILHIALAVLTIITTTAAGARLSSGNWLMGLTYSLPLLTILGLHELGHFIAARVHKIDVTPPFFIPIPFGLGTFGAYIQLRSPAVDRKGLFDVAISGPLAGFIVAVPTLLIGLLFSTIVHPSDPITRMGSFWQGVPASSSLLLSFLCELVRPGQVQFGDIVLLSPLAFAGWIGIWVTALNLIPLGQLDGGHAAHGLLGGTHIGLLNRVTYCALIIGGFLYWPGFITWALLVYFLAGQSVPPLNDITPVNRYRVLVGLIALLILIFTFCPVPPP